MPASDTPGDDVFTPFHLPPDSTPEARLAGIEQVLTETAMALDAGDAGRMDGIDHEVRILCDQVARMPAAQSMPYIEKLQTLHAAFTALGEAMAAQRDAVKDELGNLTARQKAHRAYGMGLGLPAGDDDTEGQG